MRDILVVKSVILFRSLRKKITDIIDIVIFGTYNMDGGDSYAEKIHSNKF